MNTFHSLSPSLSTQCRVYTSTDGNLAKERERERERERESCKDASYCMLGLNFSVIESLQSVQEAARLSGEPVESPAKSD